MTMTGTDAGGVGDLTPLREDFCGIVVLELAEVDQRPSMVMRDLGSRLLIYLLRENSTP